MPREQNVFHCKNYLIVSHGSCKAQVQENVSENLAYE